MDSDDIERRQYGRLWYLLNVGALTEEEVKETVLLGQRLRVKIGWQGYHINTGELSAPNANPGITARWAKKIDRELALKRAQGAAMTKAQNRAAGIEKRVLTMAEKQRKKRKEAKKQMEKDRVGFNFWEEEQPG